MLADKLRLCLKGQDTGKIYIKIDKIRNRCKSIGIRIQDTTANM